MTYGLPEVIEHDISLVEFWCQEIHICTQLAVCIGHILSDAGREQTFPALPAHDDKNLTIHPDTVLIHETEDAADQRLLP